MRFSQHIGRLRCGGQTGYENVTMGQKFLERLGIGCRVVLAGYRAFMGPPSATTRPAMISQMRRGSYHLHLQCRAVETGYTIIPLELIVWQ